MNPTEFILEKEQSISLLSVFGGSGYLIEMQEMLKINFSWPS